MNAVSSYTAAPRPPRSSCCAAACSVASSALPGPARSCPRSSNDSRSRNMVENWAGSSTTVVHESQLPLMIDRGSATDAHTELASAPGLTADATTVLLAVAPDARSPIRQLTAAPEWMQAVSGLDAKTRPAGNVSVSVTPVACEGPLLMTAIRKVTALPIYMTSGNWAFGWANLDWG